MKLSKIQLLITVLGIAVISVAVFSFIPRGSRPRDVQQIDTPREGENALIDEWIAANDLNQFGDPKDTVYTGGTPLFDERTGEQIDRYEYIIKNHPERPWKVQ